MDIKRALSKTKAVALCILIACSGMTGTAIAAAPTPGGGRTQHAAAVQANSSSTGFELDYFHAYKASKTYAIRFKNGLSATFDFEHGTAKLYDTSGNPTTLPLEQVLLQANNGNSQAATAMYNDMYNSISAAHSDAIMAYAGVESAGTNIFPPPPRGTIGIGDFNNPLWGMPGQGDCWPIPFPCNQWPGGLSNWGVFNNWWGSGFGDPPPTSQPPRPDGCAPNDIDCILWEHDRQDACGDLTMDNVTAYGSTALAGAVCGGSLGVACGGGIFVAVVAIHKLHNDQKKCRTPYPR